MSEEQQQSTNAAAEPDEELMGRLQLISEQPLEQRAQALEQLYNELKPLVD